MDYVLLIWLAGVSEKVSIYLFLPVLIYAVALLIFAMADMIDNFDFLKKIPKPLHYLMAGLLAIAVAIPDKQTVYIMAGAMAAQDMAASAIGEKTLLLLESKLDEALQEVKE